MMLLLLCWKCFSSNFILMTGPSAYSMRAMASKSAAKILMENSGVPVVPGYHGEGQVSVSLELKCDRKRDSDR